LLALVVPQMRRQERESRGRHGSPPCRCCCAAEFSEMLVLWKTCAACCCARCLDALRGFQCCSGAYLRSDIHRSSTARRVAACRVAADAWIDSYSGHLLLLLREILQRSHGDGYLTRLRSSLKQNVCAAELPALLQTLTTAPRGLPPTAEWLM